MREIKKNLRFSGRS